MSSPRSELWFTATSTRASTAMEFTATAPELLTRPGTPRAWRGFETQKQGSRSGVLRPPSRTVHPVGCERLSRTGFVALITVSKCPRAPRLWLSPLFNEFPPPASLPFPNPQGSDFGRRRTRSCGPTCPTILQPEELESPPPLASPLRGQTQLSQRAASTRKSPPRLPCLSTGQRKTRPFSRPHWAVLGSGCLPF